MKEFLNFPFKIWLVWLIRSRKVLRQNKSKNLKIGYMTELTNVKVGDFNTFYNNIKLKNSQIGDFVYIADNTSIFNTKIGKYCSIGPNVKVGLGMHPTNYISTFPAFFSTKKQCQISFTDKDLFNELGSNIIGNDVWIGSNAIILDNISIGDGAIIAAGSVVTKNVEPYTIVAGVPAKAIRKRFSDEKIDELLKLKWWDKDIDWLKTNIQLFQQPYQ